MSGSSGPTSSLLIIDGDNLLKRCWFAASRSGPKAPLRAFVGAMMRLVVRFRGGMAIVIWDGGHAPWRKKLIPNYKVRPDKPGRAERAASILDATVAAHYLLNAMKIKNVGYHGREADDVIAYLSRCCTRARIYTTDKDFFSLIDNEVHVIRSVKGEDLRVDLDNLPAITGVKTPAHYRMFKAIAGDKSDVIEGVPGVGDKTACDILRDIDEGLLVRDAPMRGMRAVLDVCENAKSKRWRRVCEKKEAFEIALRCSDLSSPHLLVPFIPGNLTSILTEKRPKPDMGQLESLMEEHGFAPSNVPSLQILTNRVTALDPEGVDFSWAKDPREKWGT